MDVLIATDFFYEASPACGPVVIKMSIANQLCASVICHLSILHLFIFNLSAISLVLAVPNTCHPV
jgi:hypothetical protein